MTKREFQTLAAFRYALRRFLRFSEDAAAEAGMTPQQYQALLAIAGYPDLDRITISQLRERLQVEHHSAVGLVNRLVSRKWVAREQSREDKRNVYVKLTASGRKSLDKLASAHRGQLKKVSPELIEILEKMQGKTKK